MFQIRDLFSKNSGNIWRKLQYNSVSGTRSPFENPVLVKPEPEYLFENPVPVKPEPEWEKSYESTAANRHVNINARQETPESRGKYETNSNVISILKGKLCEIYDPESNDLLTDEK